MIDTIIIAVLFISVLIGWFRGAVKEICSVVSWVGSGYLAYKLFPTGLEIVKEFISQPLLANIVTIIFLFVVFLIVLSLLTYIFSKIISESIFSTIDKLCGSLFGLVRGILILAVLDFGATYYIFKEPPEMMKQAKLLPYVKHTAQIMFLLLPEKTQSELVSYTSKEKQQELIKSFGGKLKETVISAQKDNSSIDSNRYASPGTNKSSTLGSEPALGNGSDFSGKSLKNNTENDQYRDYNMNSNSTDNNAENRNRSEIAESQTAKNLARLGVKKAKPNPNLSKSVRSDLDKFIDQNMD